VVERIDPNLFQLVINQLLSLMLNQLTSQPRRKVRVFLQKALSQEDLRSPLVNPTEKYK